MARDIEVLLVARLDKHLPLLVGQLHLHAQVLLPHGLERLGDGFVDGVQVVLVGDLGETLAVRVPGLGQQLFRRLGVGPHGEVILGLAAKVLVLPRPGYDIGDIGDGGLLAALRHLLHHRRPVDRQVERLSHLRVIEGRPLEIEDGEGDAERVGQLRLAALQELRRHLRRQLLVEVDLPGLRRRQRGVGIDDHRHTDLIELDLVRLPVVGVLHEGHLAVVLPLRDHKWAVAREIVLRSPAARVLVHHLGPGGGKVAEGKVFQNQRILLLKDNLERRVVNDVDPHFLGLGLAVEERLGILDEEAHVGIGSGALRIDQTHKAMLEMPGGQGLSIRPLESGAQVERPGQPILRHVPFFGRPRLRLRVRADTHEPLEDVHDDVGTVDGLVLDGIDRLGLDRQVEDDLLLRSRARPHQA